jgi:CDP-diacylglycerol--serine O-phosphatidyltransferase
VGTRLRRDLVAPLFVAGVLIATFLISFPFITMAVLTLVYLGSLPLSWRAHQRAQDGYAASAASPAPSGSEVRGGVR